MEETEIPSLEHQSVPEIPRTGWETLIFFQRHGPYYNTHPEVRGQPTPQDQKTLGRLTPEGRQQTSDISRERVKAALTQDPEKTDFLVVHSPTHWLDDQRLGQRAKETAEIVVGEVKKELEELGLPAAGHILNLATSEKGFPSFKGDRVRPELKVGEALMFQVPEFAQFLRDQNGGKQGPGFWRDFYFDKYKEKREEMGAEGPLDIANKSNQVINIAARFAGFYHQRNPDRKLVIMIVGHGDSVRPYVQRVLGVPYEDFAEGYNDGVGIGIDNEGNGKAIVKGKEYKVPLTTHGRVAPLAA